MEQLAEIYVPEESFWLNLLQPGWLTLACVLFVFLLSAFLLKKTTEKRKLRKKFINYLRQQTQLTASQTNTILKAYIRALEQHTVIAKLHGKQWRDFLLANCNLKGKMQELDYISGDYYKKDSLKSSNEGLNELAIHWIKNHKKTLIQP